MGKYEESVEELSREIQELGDRPSKEMWDQLSFEHTLFKTRIQELEEQLKQKSLKPNTQ